MVSPGTSRLLPITLLAVSACQPAPALSEADLQAIQAMTQQFEEHVNAKNWDAVSQLYTEDAVLMPPNAPTVEGRTAIREFFAALPPVAEFSSKDDTIVGLGELAYVYGRYVLSLDLEGSPVDSGKYLDIRRRQADGSWKMSVDIFNSSIPLPTPDSP